MPKTAVFSFLLIIFLFGCSSKERPQQDEEIILSEIKTGNIHLILNDRTGHFSLYHLSGSDRYEALINNREQSASYSSISVDGNVSRLGSRQFPVKLENQGGNPAFVFESSSLTVTQVFSPVTTVSSPSVNGIMITFNIRNTGSQNSSVGLKMLIDTVLADRQRGAHFTTNSREISGETIVEGISGEKYWISPGRNISLMGSIVNPLDQNAKAPDFIHFANWKRLNRSSWTLRLSEGRSFSRDSAVLYVYEPVLLSGGSSFTYTIFLTGEDIPWFSTEPAALVTPASPIAAEPAQLSAQAQISDNQTESVFNNNADRNILLRLQELLHQFINGEIDLSEQDLIEIEEAIERHRF